MADEMTPDHPDPDDDTMQAAVRDMMTVILALAIRHKVCPVCLTYVTAEAVEAGEEAGALVHGIPTGLADMETEGGMH